MILNVIINHPIFFLMSLFLFGLLMGSFLNVVIYRLPIILKTHWRQECTELLQSSTAENRIMSPYSLSTPASHCPTCQTPLNFWQKIPILSYVFLRARCAYCQHPISIRYPMVELLTGIVAIIAGLEFGVSFACLATFILGCFLITMSFIDFEHQIIPDILTLSLLWIGLLLSCFDIFIGSNDAILGAIFGYAFLRVIGQVFQWIKKKEGIGLGDCKLFAAIGSWIGWQVLPVVILTSSLLGLIVGLFLFFFKKISRNTPIPFAPFLAISAWLALIWGFDITQYYFYLFDSNWTNV